MAEKVFKKKKKKEIYTESELRSMMVGVDNNGMVVLNVDESGKPKPIEVPVEEIVEIQNGNEEIMLEEPKVEEQKEEVVEETPSTEELKVDEEKIVEEIVSEEVVAKEVVATEEPANEAVVDGEQATV